MAPSPEIQKSARAVALLFRESPDRLIMTLAFNLRCPGSQPITFLTFTNHAGTSQAVISTAPPAAANLLEKQSVGQDPKPAAQSQIDYFCDQQDCQGGKNCRLKRP